MLKLRRLRVEKFRSVARVADLSFSDGINVLLGQNGTGKTTLLELISMVVRSDFSSLAKEEFAIEYELSVGEGENIIVVVRNERVAAEQLGMPFELGATEFYRPSAEVLGGNDRRRLLQYDPEHGLLDGSGAPMSRGGLRSCLDRGSMTVLVGVVRAIDEAVVHAWLQSSGAYRFDEVLDLFRRVTDAGDLMGDILVLRKGEWTLNVFAWPFVPEALVEKVAASYKSKKSDCSFTHEELGFLATLNDMMGFSSSELRADVTKERDASIQIGRLVFRFWWEDGTFITHERLSYGQKRLLMFYYYLACNPDIVIADELVNGLHHRWLKACIEAIGQRQAFLTSQNPLLLDYIPVPSAAEVRKSFVLCRSEPRGGRPWWIWENMAEEDAKELFSAYGVGVEHVSEILQSRGLW